MLQIIHERALPGVDFGLDRNPVLSPHFENLGIGSAMANATCAKEGCTNLSSEMVVVEGV